MSSENRAIVLPWSFEEARAWYEDEFPEFFATKPSESDIERFVHNKTEPHRRDYILSLEDNE